MQLLPRPTEVPDATLEAHLERARCAIHPQPSAKDRIRCSILARVEVPIILREAKRLRQADEELRGRVWARVNHSMSAIPLHSVFRELRALLAPRDGLIALARGRVLERLEPVHIAVTHNSLKWVAAFALVVFTIRLSPFLFLTSRSIAESPLTLLQTRGEVAVLVDGQWQPVTGEMQLAQSALIQTHEGEATLVLHDDGVMRLGSHTTVALHDIADRPALPQHGTTLTLHAGRIWVQGLVPASLPGLSIATSQGRVLVHEGSVSLSEGDIVEVHAWDRRATVIREGQEIPLVAGERLELWKGNVPVVDAIPLKQYQDEVVAENLQRDAVHRKEIAGLQRERRAALAGILPTSPLYPAKRAAEAVDVLFTFTDEARAQKLLEHANTRLNEAAALIADGSGDPSASLNEYRQTVLRVATGSGDGSLVQFLLRQDLLATAADVSAALPDDAMYSLKRAVLVTSAVLPTGLVSVEEVQHVLITDTLSGLMRAVEQGDAVRAGRAFKELQPVLAEIDRPDAVLSPALREEVRASLATFASALKAYGEDGGAVDSTLLTTLRQYLPEQATPRAVLVLTDAEIDALAAGITDRIFLYKHPRSRWNQLVYEFHALDGHPDQGRILRRLYHALPENGLARFVRTEFQRVKEARLLEQQEFGQL